jgi:hypothetical protein
MAGIAQVTMLMMLAAPLSAATDEIVLPSGSAARERRPAAIGIRMEAPMIDVLAQLDLTPNDEAEMRSGAPV